MKKTSKILGMTLLVFAAVFTLGIDSNGELNLVNHANAMAIETTSTGSGQKWEAKDVDCLDDDNNVYAQGVGCFGGTADSCTPKNCPPYSKKK